MKDTCVIYNPNAGRKRAAVAIDTLRWHLRERCDFWPTAAAGEAESLVHKAIAAGFRIIGAAGGDGTVHEVANGLIAAGRPDIALAVFPLGSANDYAFSLGLDSNWWTSLERGISPRWVDVGVVRSELRKRYFVNGLGVGFNCAVTIEARRFRRLRGVALYSLALLRALCTRYATPQMEVMVDSRLHAGPLLAMCVGLGRREGNFLLTPEALLDDGWFDYVKVGPLPRWKLVSYIPRIISGRIPRRDLLIEVGRCRRLQFRSQVPLAVHTDGEFFCVPEDKVPAISIELIPRALQVITIDKP
jgi:diacylglycerol kinase family enzyme